MIITNLMALAMSVSISHGTPDDFHFMTETQYKAKMKWAKNRKPAQSENDNVNYPTAFSDSFKNLSAKIMGGRPWKDNKEMSSAPAFPGIHSAYDMDKLLVELEQGYNGMGPDAKFVGAQLLALKPWRGFVYRVRPLFENNSQFTHAYVITLMRMLMAGTNTYLPTKEWKAAFDYITQPYPGADKQLITTEAELYDFVKGPVLDTMKTLAVRMENLNFTTPVYFDNKLFYSEANFASNSDRYTRLGEAERQAYLSGVLMGLAGVNYSIAYNWKGLMKTIDNFVVVYGINSSINVDRMTAERRTGALKSESQLFTLRKDKNGNQLPENKEHTQLAKKYYVEGVRNAKLAWAQLKKDSNNVAAQANLFDPRAYVPFTRVIDATFTNVENLTNDRGIASAMVTGEVVNINFNKFFDDPPEDMKAFLPTNFKPSSPKELTEPVSGLKYRNYDAGNPDGWNIRVYNKYFPSINNNADVRSTARILSQSWGGWVIGFPFSAVVL